MTAIGRTQLPVTVTAIPGGVKMHVVAALCGKLWTGMTQSDDLPIQLRRALAHAEDCAACEHRWALLCTPGTKVSVGDMGATS